ncbi:hypothetical protein BX616_009071 [Lobosporangium transversale]|nr:hypothetical protein BX616_009071 [Lobosporangium transversale]
MSLMTQSFFFFQCPVPNCISTIQFFVAMTGDNHHGIPIYPTARALLGLAIKRRTTIIPHLSSFVRSIQHDRFFSRISRYCNIFLAFHMFTPSSSINQDATHPVYQQQQQPLPSLYPSGTTAVEGVVALTLSKPIRVGSLSITLGGSSHLALTSDSHQNPRNLPIAKLPNSRDALPSNLEPNQIAYSFETQVPSRVLVSIMTPQGGTICQLTAELVLAKLKVVPAGIMATILSAASASVLSTSLVNNTMILNIYRSGILDHPAMLSRMLATGYIKISVTECDVAEKLTQLVVVGIRECIISTQRMDSGWLSNPSMTALISSGFSTIERIAQFNTPNLIRDPNELHSSHSCNVSTYDRIPKMECQQLKKDFENYPMDFSDVKLGSDIEIHFLRCSLFITEPPLRLGKKLAVERQISDLPVVVREIPDRVEVSERDGHILPTLTSDLISTSTSMADFILPNEDCDDNEMFTAIMRSRILPSYEDSISQPSIDSVLNGLMWLFPYQTTLLSMRLVGL